VIFLPPRPKRWVADLAREYVIKRLEENWPQIREDLKDLDRVTRLATADIFSVCTKYKLLPQLLDSYNKERIAEERLAYIV